MRGGEPTEGFLYDLSGQTQKSLVTEVKKAAPGKLGITLPLATIRFLDHQLVFRSKAIFFIHDAPLMATDISNEEENTSRPRSTAYREFLADREDLLRHKWLMSEKAGRDVGLELALFDWAEHSRVAMRKQR